MFGHAYLSPEMQEKDICTYLAVVLFYFDCNLGVQGQK